MRILINTNTVFVPDTDENQMIVGGYEFDIIVVEVNAKTYRRTRMYIKFDWFKPFVHKFVDVKGDDFATIISEALGEFQPL